MQVGSYYGFVGLCVGSYIQPTVTILRGCVKAPHHVLLCRKLYLVDLAGSERMADVMPGPAQQQQQGKGSAVGSGSVAGSGKSEQCQQVCGWKDGGRGCMCVSPICRLLVAKQLQQQWSAS